MPALLCRAVFNVRATRERAGRIELRVRPEPTGDDGRACPSRRRRSAGETDGVDAIVLAGGASRRMGTDKTRIVLGGRTLLERSVDALHLAGADQIVVVGRNGRADGLPDGVVGVADSHPGSGPLHGIIDGLRHLADVARNISDVTVEPPGGYVVVVVAADHPDHDPVELAYVASLLTAASPDTAAVIPVVNGRDQTLHAAYRRWVAEPLAAQFEAGERSLHRALDAHPTLRPERTGPVRRSYRDLDDPNDLEAYRAESTTGREEHSG